MKNDSSARSFQPVNRTAFPSYQKTIREATIGSNDQVSFANDIRMISLETRIETLEKMLHFYDEMLRLKDEEHKNDYQLDSHKLSELSSKINHLEANVTSMNKKINDQHQFLIGKIDHLQIQVSPEEIRRIVIDCMKAYKDNEPIITSSSHSASLNDYCSSKLGELEAMIKKHSLLNESIVDDKLSIVQAQFENRLTDILSIIQDLNKITEGNEYGLTEFKETIRGIQNDNVELVKIVSIQKEKGKQIDYLLEQITDLKGKYTKLLQIFNDNLKEEETFLQNYLPSLNDKHND